LAKLKEFVACRNCRALVISSYKEKGEPCPVCGKVDYSEEWEGMVVILDTKSYVAQLMGVQKPWRYAVKVK
jgi:DNA-directed RNA polymerase, subunit E''''